MGMGRVAIAGVDTAWSSHGVEVACCGAWAWAGLHAYGLLLLRLADVRHIKLAQQR